ncbi:hypothetical protein KELASSE_215 [Escherichia phage vB_EcoM_Kelasse]|nr:hypothetical protein KELASSE_215 [Escherichia phage vB_EcoM_Kelasse]
MKTINLNAAVKTKCFNGKYDETMWFLMAVEGDIIEVETAEGMGTDFTFTIQVHNFFTGWIYELNTVIVGKIEQNELGEWYYVTARQRAERLIEKMKKVGKLDMQHWKVVK